jgi:hypothetical protein
MTTHPREHILGQTGNGPGLLADIQTGGVGDGRGWEEEVLVEEVVGGMSERIEESRRVAIERVECCHNTGDPRPIATAIIYLADVLAGLQEEGIIRGEFPSTDLTKTGEP